MMHTNTMCFYRRGGKEVIPSALGKGFVLIFWSRKLRKWEYAKTVEFKISASNVWVCCMSASCKEDLGKLVNICGF